MEIPKSRPNPKPNPNFKLSLISTKAIGFKQN